MAVSKVEKAIRHVQSVVNEWNELGATWREDHTRYALIDPIIRALGWDTADPKQCHPEFPRGNAPRKRVDYVIFAEATAEQVYELHVLPDIIIEAKAFGVDLGAGRSQLGRYVRSSPRMEKGIAVLTNGVD